MLKENGGKKKAIRKCLDLKHSKIRILSGYIVYK